jgi:diacylglycerol kinase (ATP)
MDPETSIPSQRVTLIRNPAARRSPSDRSLRAPLDALRARGWEVEVRDTEAAGDAQQIAADAAASGVSVVVACGGDGTVNEVLNGVAGTDTALAVLPAGTANVWAAEIGVSAKPPKALGLLASGRQVRVDTGAFRLGEGDARKFLLMCSAGLDAAVVQAMADHALLKRRLGRASGVWPSIRALLRTRPVATTITVGGRERRGSLSLVVVGNSRLYGGIARITDDAVMNDGLLDVVTFSGHPGASIERRIGERAIQLSWALSGSLSRQRHRSVHYLRASTIEFRPDEPLPVQVDGEFIGEAGPDSALELWSEPASVSVVVPVGHNPLFDD